MFWIVLNVQQKHSTPKKRKKANTRNKFLGGQPLFRMMEQKSKQYFVL
jgi:hypothetical protein